MVVWTIADHLVAMGWGRCGDNSECDGDGSDGSDDSVVTSARADAVSLMAALTSFFSLLMPSNDLGNYNHNINNDNNRSRE